MLSDLESRILSVSRFSKATEVTYSGKLNKLNLKVSMYFFISEIPTVELGVLDEKIDASRQKEAGRAVWAEIFCIYFALPIP